MDIVKSLWFDILGPVVNSIDNSLLFWKIISALLITSVAAAYTFRKRLLKFVRNEKTVEHDRRVFLELNKLLSEESLEDIIYSLSTTCSLSQDETRSIHNFIRFANRVENSFLLENLRRDFGGFCESFEKLNDFATTHFFTREGRDGYTLYPEIKYTKPELYESRLRELYQIIDNVSESFKRYRVRIANELIL